MLETLQVWYDQNQELFAWGLGLSVLTFIGSLVAVPIIIVQMSEDYFLRPVSNRFPRTPWQLARRLIKNLLGALLFLTGLAMLFLPGQGLLTILLALGLLDFPGKRHLQLKIIRSKSVYSSVNWIRSKYDRPPIRLPDQS